MIKKYLLMPGKVYSMDGDEHYISPVKLMKLYKVQMSECLIYSPKTSSRIPEDIIILEPRADGDYEQHLSDIEK